MARRAKPEEIIAKLREDEVRLSRGEATGQAVRAIGVTEKTYYRWRREDRRPAVLLHRRAKTRPRRASRCCRPRPACAHHLWRRLATFSQPDANR